MSYLPFPEETVEKFVATDKYICSSLLQHDEGLSSALEANRAAQVDEIDVAPNQGKLLYLLTKMTFSTRILEVGTLGGYSAIWFAKAVGSGGQVITLELEPEHARIARSNIKNAGFEGVVQVREGKALETLEKMGEEGWGKEGRVFDLMFIDADKENNTEYVQWGLKFAKKGTVIVVDNVGRKGRIANPEDNDESVKGVRRMFEYIKGEKRLDATAIQTLGSKGWDGFAVALVVE
ncbi:hypothetical protein B7494_g2952 [Chlorociboria aeruginascens]|nr:hypothetical protein B7494_g2952 [Chlorociboria aeruginascens]